MLKLNDTVLEMVSGGHFSLKITNKNYSNIKVSHVFLGDDSTFFINVSQSIG